jgi:hypothetical protein
VVREVAGRAIANLDLVPKTDDPQMEVEIRLLPGIVIADACVSRHWASSYDHLRGDDDFTLLWSSVPAKGWVASIPVVEGGRGMCGSICPAVADRSGRKL